METLKKDLYLGTSWPSFSKKVQNSKIDLINWNVYKVIRGEWSTNHVCSVSPNKLISISSMALCNKHLIYINRALIFFPTKKYFLTHPEVILRINNSNSQTLLLKCQRIRHFPSFSCKCDIFWIHNRLLLCDYLSPNILFWKSVQKAKFDIFFWKILCS